MILDNYYTTDSAALFIGVTETTIRNMTARGELSPRKIGNANVYHLNDLLECKRKWYADGLSATEIAEKYGVGKAMVHYHFNNLKVKSVGVDGRRKGQPTIFDPDTVDKMAEIIGWEISPEWTEPTGTVRCPSCLFQSPRGDRVYLESAQCPKCKKFFRIPD